MDQQLSSYNYDLPPELIAQNPVTPRDRSRLLVVDSPTHHCHGHFYELPQWLRPGDLLVLNNTQVIPARLYGQKSTGAPVEILLLEEKSTACWLALVKPGKRFKIGSEILFSPNGLQTGEQPPLKATVIDRDPETGGRILQFHLSDPAAFWRCLDQYGEIPFPPYVTDSSADVSQYQTIYAQRPGAVAAPTAGLHFTPELFATLAEKGIQTAELTLHVGVGTFRPVEVEDVKTHQMHQEWIDVNAETVEKIRQTKANGDRIIAVGTTAVRALEGAIKEQRKKLSQSAISNHTIHGANGFVYLSRVSVAGCGWVNYEFSFALFEFVNAGKRANWAAAIVGVVSRCNYASVSFLFVWGCDVDFAGGLSS